MINTSGITFFSFLHLVAARFQVNKIRCKFCSLHGESWVHHHSSNNPFQQLWYPFMWFSACSFYYETIFLFFTHSHLNTMSLCILKKRFKANMNSVLRQTRCTCVFTWIWKTERPHSRKSQSYLCCSMVLYIIHVCIKWHETGIHDLFFPAKYCQHQNRSRFVLPYPLLPRLLIEMILSSNDPHVQLQANTK